MQHNDPFNLIITGVGGQGNLVASQVLGRALLKKGYSFQFENLEEALSRLV